MAKSRFSTKGLISKYSKWDSRSFRTGYKSTSSLYGNSSFWMDDDFLSDRTERTGRAVDYVKLAGYKRAISNFVRIVTSKDNIPVIYSSGNDSYTDGKKVVISAKLDEKAFDSTVGLALHEGSHIALTNFNVLSNQLGYGSAETDRLVQWHKETFNEDTAAGSISPKVKDLVNIIEDRRIDRFVFNSAPGYQGYYLAMYDKYFNSKDIDKALIYGLKAESTWDDYIFHICNFANPNRKLDTLPSLRAIWNKINIANISRLKTTDEVYELAVEIYKMIMEAVGGMDQNEEKSKDSKGKGNNSPDSMEPADINEDGDEDPNADPNMDGQGGQGKTKGKGEGKESEEEGEGGESDQKYGKLAKDNSGTPRQPMTDREKADLEKVKRNLPKAIAAQKEFTDGKIKKGKLSKADATKINAAAESNMSYETVGGDIHNNTGNKLTNKTTRCMVIKGMNPRLIDAGMVNNHWEPRRTPEYYQATGRQDFVSEGIMLGTLLGKKLKTRDEERSLKTTRMETGRMDRRMIAELGFGNDRVFSQTHHYTVTPALVHISLDASGSMGGKKWFSALKTALAIAKAASMTSSLHCIISLRGCFNSSGYGSEAPLMWEVYDSRKDKLASVKNKFYSLGCNASTPEGLCFEAIMADTIKAAQGKDMYFINISDGEPGYSDNSMSYGGEYAVQHTKIQVDKMRKNGINVLSYFVSEGGSEWGMSRSRQAFETMYGKEAAFIDVNNLNQLSKTLNHLFERKGN